MIEKSVVGIKQTGLDKRKMCDVIDGKCTVDYNIIRDL